MSRIGSAAPAALVDEKVYKADTIELYELDGAVLDAIAATLERTNAWDVAVTGGTVYLSTGAGSFELAVRRVQ